LLIILIYVRVKKTGRMSFFIYEKSKEKTEIYQEIYSYSEGANKASVFRCKKTGGIN